MQVSPKKVRNVVPFESVNVLLPNKIRLQIKSHDFLSWDYLNYFISNCVPPRRSLSSGEWVEIMTGMSSSFISGTRRSIKA